MISHKDLESNCKRIAKAIRKGCTDSEVLLMGRICLTASTKLLEDFKTVGKKKYIKEINKHLKGLRITSGDIGFFDKSLLVFDIEFDEVDPETEDW
jgi:hypothetical protein